MELRFLLGFLFCGKLEKSTLMEKSLNQKLSCTSNRVVVMVQWLAHPTSNQGDAGSIPTHGTLRFSFNKVQSVVVHCYWLVTTSLDFQPSSYTQNYIYIYI